MPAYRLELVFGASEDDLGAPTMLLTIEAGRTGEAIADAARLVQETASRPLRSATLTSREGFVLWRLSGPDGVESAEGGEPILSRSCQEPRI